MTWVHFYAAQRKYAEIGDSGKSASQLGEWYVYAIQRPRPHKVYE